MAVTFCPMPGLQAEVFALMLMVGACSQPNAPSCITEGEEDCAVRVSLVRGAERTWVVSHRGQLDCSKGKVPVVFAFHGYGDSGSGLRSYLGVEEQLLGQALFVYPDGQPQLESLMATGWNRAAGSEDLAFFDAMLEELAKDDCLDTTRVFSVGHSRGARMVEALSCHRAEAHRGFALIASGSDADGECPGTGPVMLSHGIEDGTIGFAEGSANRDRWARRNGCESPTGQEFPVDVCTPLRGCREEAPVSWCPSTAKKWNGHGPAEFLAGEIAGFFQQRF